MDSAEIRREIATTAPDLPLRESASRACFEALLRAQEAGATGPERVALLTAFYRETRAMEAELALAVSPA